MIHCPDFKLGKFSTIHPSARITASKFHVGDCTEIGENFRCDSGEVEIGDYGVIYENCLFYGKEKISIGHNFFLGGNSILNSYAPLTIGKGVGIGAHSQVFTHASWGEEIEGCLFNKIQPTTISDHAWLMGHVIVGSGCSIAERTIVLPGAVLARTQSGLHSNVLGGVPAVPVPMSAYAAYHLDDKWKKLIQIAEQFLQDITYKGNPEANSFKLASLIFWKNRETANLNGSFTHFFLDTKTYTKKLTPMEVAFMRFCRGGKVRFFPE